jgi:hypothetical protein
VSDFTPGPWKVATKKDSYWNERYYTIIATLTDIGEMPIGNFDGDNAVWLHEGEDVANAQLASASPDMYNALKEEMKEWDSCNHPSFRVMELIQDAINKAEGNK